MPTCRNDIVPEAFDEHLHRLLIKRLHDWADGEPPKITIFHKPQCKWIADDLGFSPLVDPKTGCTYPDDGFRPFWIVQRHVGWFEMTVSLGAREQPAIFVLFLKDSDECDPTLRAMCRQFASSSGH
jgi:hypothetical protein